ncbi:MAG: hypothetical protein JSW27_19190 [Phycisphaerales bacterium]|nr:MAG: hypothetical protein JSW27_19190 [Phycisphaerales bacterium]
MSKIAKTPESAIAVVRDETEFRAVALHRQHDGVEIRWAKRMAAETGTWGAFAAECGVADVSRGAGPSQPVVAVGLDATAVAFYKINAPNVGREETDAIVRMQTESLLPLPPAQIEVAWRTLPSTNGNVDVTIAAARRDYLRRFAQDARPFRPQRLLPACEGTARTWHDLFSERERQALIISIGSANTQICVVQNGCVVNAAVLDIGMNDLAIVDGDAAGSPQAAEMIERFVQDIHSVLESFHWSPSLTWPMLVLSDGSERLTRIVAALNHAGLDVKASIPKPQTLGMPVGLDRSDLYEYRAPVGLALMLLDGPIETLDLLARMSEAEQDKKAKSAWHSVRLAALAAVVMLAVLIATWCAGDLLSERRLSALVAQPEFEQARERQTLLKTVARHRPDMLALLTELSAGENDGIVLDTLHFKKGQAVTIMGRADNMEKMWKYQEDLLTRKGIKDVEISSNAQDAKAKKIKFTMVFHYRGFTKKDAVL